MLEELCHTVEKRGKAERKQQLKNQETDRRGAADKILNAVLRLVAGETNQHDVPVAQARASSDPNRAFTLKNILDLEDHSFILNHSNYESVPATPARLLSPDTLG
jgi:uncharacterized protein YdaT